MYFPGWWIKNVCILIPQSGNAIWHRNFGKVFLVFSAILNHLKWLFFFLYPVGQRRWSGMGPVAGVTDRRITTVRHGGPETMRWQAWPRLCRLANSSSRPPAAAPVPTSCCASRTATWHNPRNKAVLKSFWTLNTTVYTGPVSLL